MTLAGLLAAVASDEAVAEAVRRARATGTAGATAALDIAAPDALQPLLIAALAAPSAGDRPVLAVTATDREAEVLRGGLQSLLPEDSVADFPGWETLPHERLSPSSDTVGRRLAALRRLAHPSADDPATGPVRVLVAPIRAVLQPLVRGLGDLEPVRIEVGQDVAMEDVVRRLAAAAYTRTDLVEGRGQFAVRGGILDVFPPTEEHPLRLEFWGDTVEEVRWFRVADQRSLEAAPYGLYAPPCRELLLTDDVRQRAKALAQQHPELVEMLDQLADGTAVDGMEALAPVLTDEMQLLVELLPAGAMVVVCDPERVRRRAHDLVATSQEFLQASWHNAAAGNATPIDVGAAAYRSIAEVRRAALERDVPWWGISPFAGDEELVDASVDDVEQLVVPAAPSEAYRGDTAKAMAQLEEWVSDDWAVLLVTAGHGTAQRFGESVRAAGPATNVEPDLVAPRGAGSSPSRPARSSTGSCCRRGGWRCSPRPTLWGRRPRPRTAAGCRRGGGRRSTRCS